MMPMQLLPGALFFTNGGPMSHETELRQAAIAALKKHPDDLNGAARELCSVVRKRSDLLEALALDYVTRIGAARPPTQTSTTAAPPPIKPIKVREHRRRTPGEREAALTVAGDTARAVLSVFDRPIFGRRLGDLRWGELRTLCHDMATNAADYLRLGTDATENFAMMTLMLRHAQPADQGALVRDTISEKKAREYAAMAPSLTVQLLERGIAAYVATLESAMPKELPTS
jgi:hypothetical protein